MVDPCCRQAPVPLASLLMLDWFSKKWTCQVCDAKNAHQVSFCPNCGTRRKDNRDSYDAFISYRRDGGSEAATVIQMVLETLGKHAFLDVTELQVGRFDEKLLERIEKDRSFILILSPGALDRCVNKNDWLKREIVHAFRHGRSIIPVMLAGFQFPDEATMALMPKEMHDLPNYQAVHYSHENREGTGRKIAQFIAAGSQAVKRAPRDDAEMGSTEDTVRSRGEVGSTTARDVPLDPPGTLVEQPLPRRNSVGHSLPEGATSSSIPNVPLPITSRGTDGEPRIGLIRAESASTLPATAAERTTTLGAGTAADAVVPSIGIARLIAPPIGMSPTPPTALNAITVPGPSIGTARVVKN